MLQPAIYVRLPLLRIITVYRPAESPPNSAEQHAEASEHMTPRGKQTTTIEEEQCDQRSTQKSHTELLRAQYTRAIERAVPAWPGSFSHVAELI